MSPPVFHLRQSQRDLTAMAGLAFIGQGLHRFAQIAQLDARFPVRSGLGLPTSAIVSSYVGLLSEGKSDFDAIEGKRRDPFFAKALGVAGVPSAATLRQRMDALTCADEAIDALLAPMLQRGRAQFTPLSSGHVPLDIDVFCLDNSRTKKEGVGRTYAGFDGYAPLAAYLGSEGFCLGLELRCGTQHSASETEYALERVLPRALSLTRSRLLLRADSGFDSTALYTTALNEGQGRVDVLFKWNPRGMDGEALAEHKRRTADTVWTSPRPGKRFTRWESAGRTLVLADGSRRTLRRILQLTERHTDASGNSYLFPRVEMEGWETTLTEPLDAVIALYCDHGTHEQFHSEFKTDLDLERLPSGKFATNALVLSLAALTYNLLRLLGQQSLTGEDAPLRHPAKRRRIKTVMQEMMRVAVTITRHGRRLILNFARHCPVFELWRRRYAAWQGEPPLTA